MDDPIDALLAFVAAPAPGFEPTDADAFAAPAFGRALTALHRRSVAERDDAVHRLAAGIRGAGDAYQAARLAVICGTAVEWGVDPGIPGPAILDRLAAEVRAGGGDPRAERSIRLLCIAAMAVLSRSVGLRHHARGLPDLVQALEPLALAEAEFVRITLGLVDDLELLVLHLERQEGARVRLEGVASNFHLLTLLQATFPAWCEEPPDPEVVAQARGEAPPAPLDDHARFQAFTAVGSALWGEATPVAIPEVRGARFVLVSSEHGGARRWDSGFFPNIHDALHPAVHVVERLSAEVVRGHLAHLGRGGAG